MSNKAHVQFDSFLRSSENTNKCKRDRIGTCEDAAHASWYSFRSWTPAYASDSFVPVSRRRLGSTTCVHTNSGSSQNEPPRCARPIKTNTAIDCMSSYVLSVARHSKRCTRAGVGVSGVSWAAGKVFCAFCNARTASMSEPSRIVAFCKSVDIVFVASRSRYRHETARIVRAYGAPGCSACAKELNNVRRNSCICKAYSSLRLFELVRIRTSILTNKAMVSFRATALVRCILSLSWKK